MAPGGVCWVRGLVIARAGEIMLASSWSTRADSAAVEGSAGSVAGIRWFRFSADEGEAAAVMLT
jgi:hypothetical protein